MTPLTPGMAVTVTLVFSDEAHREAWLLQQGIVPNDPEVVEGILQAGADTNFYSEDSDLVRKMSKRMDYNRLRDNLDLAYMVDPIDVPCSAGIPFITTTGGATAACEPEP